MSSEEEAQKATEMFNGKDIDGKNVTVNEAKPLESRPQRSGFNRENRGFGGNRRDRW
jgi:RNA recognition motif-containing protein